MLFRLLNWGCMKKVFSKWPANYKGKMLEAVEPPDPSNILWPN